jgi:quinol monooxygenase YgiN
LYYYKLTDVVLFQSTPKEINMSKIVLLVKITGYPGKDKELLDELRLIVEPSRSESGCIKYDLNCDPANKDVFWFVEEWASQSDLDSHNQTAHFKRLQERKADLVAGSERALLQPVG